MQQVQTDGSYNELYPKTDAWTKDETLSAQVASVLGLRDNYKPDDAFLGLYFGAGTYRYRIRVVLEDGTPVQGSTISGIQAIQGQSLVTNEQGYVLGKSTSQSVTISCTSPYIDQAAPTSQTVISTGTITNTTLTLTSITSMRVLTGSQTAKVSPLAKTMDVTAVGGGGGGGGFNQNETYRGAGAGGGGGYVLTKSGVECTGKLLKFIVGGGGSGSHYADGKAEYGGNGGNTSLQIDEVTILNASGGQGGEGGSNGTTAGGSGNGRGGNGGRYDYEAEVGSAGSGYIFNDSSLGYAGGGGGGGGYSNNNAAEETAKGGGLPYGGKGGVQNSPYSGTSGSGPGGGGGGAGGSNGSGGSGHGGQMWLRFHF